MPVTTFLHDGELNQNLDDPELQTLINETRNRINQDVQVTRTLITTGVWWWKKEYYRYALYFWVDGCGPWQVITACNARSEVMAYLYGLNTGLDKARNQKAP